MLEERSSGRILWVFEMVLYAFIALIPLLWFSHNKLITGGDIDFPLDPIGRLYERIFAWNPLLLGGTDRSLDVSTLAFSAIEAIPYWIFHNLVLAEKIAFVFWFLASGVAMAFMMWAFYPQKRIARIAATVFYMVNFYQFYNWEIARIGELSATVFMPIVFGAFILAFKRRISMAGFALLLSLSSILCMGIGVQPPIIYACLLFVVPFVLVEVWKSGGECGVPFRKSIAIVVFGIAVIACANATWLIPEANFIVSSGYTDATHGKQTFATGALLDWTSTHSSFYNNFILSGRTVGYDIWGGEPYQPLLYGELQNKWIHAAAMALPVLAFSAILFIADRWVIYFALTALLSIFLSKGLHPPFAGIYSWLGDHLPGFWVIRAPWEKFALVTSLAYAFLLGVTVDGLLKKFGALFLRFSPRVSMYASISLGAFLVVANFAYNYPLLLGGNFPERHGVLYGFHQSFPKYADDAATWLNAQPGEFKVIPLPDSKVSVYKWGYAAPLDIAARYFKKSVLDRQYGEGTAPPHPVFTLYDNLIEALYGSNQTGAEFVARLLNVKYFLERNDVDYNYYRDRYDSPSFVAEKLSKLSNVKLARRFGAWDFYGVNNSAEHYEGTTQIYFTDVQLASLGKLIPEAPINAAYVSQDIAMYDINRLEENLPSGIRAASLLRKETEGPPESKRSVDADIFRIYPKVLIDAVAYQGVKNVVVRRPAYSDEMPTGPTFHFLGGQREWQAYNSTLVFVTTGALPFEIDSVSQNGGTVLDVVGAVWKNGWVGFGSTPVQFPIEIPPFEHAIIQINHISPGDYAINSGGVPYPVHVRATGHGRFGDLTRDKLSFLTDKRGNVRLTLFFSNMPTIPQIKIDDTILRAALIQRQRQAMRIVYQTVSLKAGEHLIGAPTTLGGIVGGFAQIGSLNFNIPVIAVSGKRDTNVQSTVRAGTALPFVLIFNENFNPGWQIYSGVVPWYLLPFDHALVAPHFLVNGYANAWIIPSTRAGLYTLFFWPQVFAYAGFIVTLLTVLASVIFVLAGKRRIRRSVVGGV